MIETNTTYICDICGKTKDAEGLIGWWQITNPGVDIRGNFAQEQNAYEICSYSCMRALATMDGDKHAARTMLGFR